MSFCPTCGRQRADSSRFCGGCGHEFDEQAVAGETAPAAAVEPAAEPAPLAEPAPPAKPAGWDISPEVTRWDRPVDATRMEPSGAPSAPAEPDPFAAWFAPDAPTPPADQPVPPRAGPADRWQTADTMYAAPNQQGSRQTSYAPPPPPPGPAYPPPGPAYPPGPIYGAPARRPARGARAALIIVAVLVVLGAGGAAYALFPKSNNPATVAPPSTTTAAATPTAPTGSASTSPSVSASPRASASPSVVSVTKGVAANPATPQVETVLSHYFQGINTHSYAEYSSALDPREQAKQTQATFDSGYSTTADSGMTLTSLTKTSGGGLAATVTFTSHQAASKSVDNSACNNWTLTFYLVPQGTGYLDGPPPSGSPQPTYSDC